MTKRSPFRYFKTSPEIIRLAVMLYVRFPLSLRNVEDPLHECGIETSHETVRYWWNRFGPMFAAELTLACLEDGWQAWAGHREHMPKSFSGGPFSGDGAPGGFRRLPPSY